MSLLVKTIGGASMDRTGVVQTSATSSSVLLSSLGAGMQTGTKLWVESSFSYYVLQEPSFVAVDGYNVEACDAVPTARWVREGIVTPAAASLKFWLDGLDMDLAGNASFVNGDPISTWNNKGTLGSAADVSAAGGLRPTYTASAINARPAALFAATQQLTGATSPVGLQAARHVFAVMDVSPGVGHFFSPRGATANSYVVGAGSSSVLVENNFTTTNCGIPSNNTAGLSICEWGFDGIAANLVSFTINGVAQVVTNGAGVGVGVESAAAGVIIGDVLQFTSYLGELMVYTGLQTAAPIRSYLSSKWGIAA